MILQIFLQFWRIHIDQYLGIPHGRERAHLRRAGQDQLEQRVQPADCHALRLRHAVQLLLHRRVLLEEGN